MTLSILFFAIFFCLITVFVFLPVIRGHEMNIEMALDNAADERKNLQIKRSQLMLTLKELDFDYEMGKLSKQDYLVMRKKYEQETVETLKMIDQDRLDRDEFQSDLDKKLKKYDA